MYCITFYMCDGSKYVIGGVGAGAYGLLRDKTDRELRYVHMDESKLIDYQCDQLQELWALSRILYGLLLEFENNFKLIKYRK